MAEKVTPHDFLTMVIDGIRRHGSFTRAVWEAKERRWAKKYTIEKLNGKEVKDQDPELE